MSDYTVSGSAHSECGGGNYIVVGTSAASPAKITISVPWQPIRVKFVDLGSCPITVADSLVNWPTQELWWLRLALNAQVNQATYSLVFPYHSGPTAAIAQWSVATTGVIEVSAAVQDGFWDVSIPAAAQTDSHRYQITIERGSYNPVYNNVGGLSALMTAGTYCVVDNSHSNETGVMTIRGESLGGDVGDLTIPLGFVPNHFSMRYVCQDTNQGEYFWEGYPMVDLRQFDATGVYDYLMVLNILALDLYVSQGLPVIGVNSPDPRGAPDAIETPAEEADVYLNRSVFGGNPAVGQLAPYVAIPGAEIPGGAGVFAGETPSLIIPSAAWAGGATTLPFCITVRR